MCYTFICDCDTDLLNNIQKMLGETHYFVVLIGYLNLFYTDKKDKYYQLRSILVNRRILMHTVTEKDMRLLLKSGDSGAFHNIIGDLPVYKIFLGDTA